MKIRNKKLGLIGSVLVLGLSLSLTGCGSSHSKKEVINKILSVKKMKDKIHITQFMYSEISKDDTFNSTKYKYTLVGTFTKKYCDKPSIMNPNKCYGTEYDIGNEITLKDSIDLPN